MSITRVRLGALLTAAVLATGLAGCAASSAGSTADSSSTTGGTQQLSGTVTVFAAASLKATFTKIASEFETANPGTKVTLNFAGSSDLDTKNMAKLSEAQLTDGSASNFATNVLEIAVPPANPASISSFADLAKPGVKVVVCAPQVPCGSATEKVEKATGTALKPVSEESSVTDVLGKVTSGEADAGLVYVTDVKTAGDKVRGIPFSESEQAVNTYPIATVGSRKNKELAKAFIAMVTGNEGKKVLKDAGFGTP
jgi:molybdate transport system substrate-binding protein